MSILLSVQVTLLFAYFCGYVHGWSCSSATDCITCVSKQASLVLINIPCEWCPLTRSCHAYLSLFNTCPSGGNSRITSDCYDKQYGVYHPETAYINVLLSAVAYSDHPQKCMEKLLPNGDFKIVAAIGRKCSDFNFDYRECFAAVAVSDAKNLIVVTNRGSTHVTQLLEQVLTILTIPKQTFKSGGKVQKYFNDAFNLLYPCVAQYVKDLLKSKPGYKVVITGHSLGAAIASLTAVSLVHDNIISEDKMALYTFGMPRVGDKEYALQHDKLVNNSWRVVHGNDIVTRVPLGVNINPDNEPYHHKTEVYYPKDDMPPDAFYKVCEINEDPTCVNSNDFNPLEYDIDYHRYYFNIHVGTMCRDVGARRRRSADGEEISAMDDMFTSDACKIIDLEGNASDKINNLEGNTSDKVINHKGNESGQSLLETNFPLVYVVTLVGLFLHC